jgi:hypothetical protein
MAYGAARRRRRHRGGYTMEDGHGQEDDDHPVDDHPAGYLARIGQFYTDYIEPLAVYFPRRQQQHDEQDQAPPPPPPPPPPPETIRGWWQTARHAVSN